MTAVAMRGKVGGRGASWWMLPWVLVSVSACLSPAEERVRADEEVGRAEHDGASIVVQDGLAAVTRFAAGDVELWSSAPNYVFELVLPSRGSVELAVRNIVPGSRLSQLSGPAIEIEPFEPDEREAGLPGDAARSLPTRAHYRLTSTNRGSFTLALTAPGAEQQSAFRIGLLSDVQEAIGNVQDIFALLNAQPDLDFLLGAGDLTQQGSTEQLSRFQRELESLNIPYYTTLGNHELGTDPPPYHSMFGRGNLSFEHKGAFFTLLDSASATLDPTVYDWLQEWTARARDALHVVAMHIPPVDPTGVRNGSFASRAEANKLLGRLKQDDVDLTLYGHVHSYYRFDNGGIAARISGGGGAIPERFDNIGRHFLVIQLEPVTQGFRTEIVRVD